MQGERWPSVPGGAPGSRPAVPSPRHCPGQGSELMTLVHPAVVVSTSFRASPKCDAEVPTSWVSLPYPTGVGCPRFVWPRAPRLPGEGAAGGHPQAEGPGAARRAEHSPRRTPLQPGPAGGTPLSPSHTETCCYPPLLRLHPGWLQAGGAAGTPSPPTPSRCRRQQQWHPRRAQHRPGSLKVKPWRRGKPRCPPQTPHLPPARPLTVLEVTAAAAGWAGGSELR